MMHVVVFYVAQLLASAYAVRRGGAPERLVAVLMVVAAIATTIGSSTPGLFRTVNWAQLYVDAAFMIALLVVAARADRYWPMYLAALHLVGVAVHGVRAYDPGILPIVYSRAAVAIAYPMLLLLVIGTVRHHRRVQRQGSAERDWSPIRW